MIAQPLFDALADELVADGTLVSYSSLQRALRIKHGQGASDRDLQQPYADWRHRRRYKGHLAVLDLPEEMEKAIAAFAATAMKVAEARAQAALPVLVGQGSTQGLLEQMQRIVSGMEKQLVTIADENRALREQLTALQPPPVVQEVEEEVTAARLTKGKRERKTGAALIAATAFWDRVVADLAARILTLGRPMSADELLSEIPRPIVDFAALAFQALNKKSLEHKLEQRIAGKKYGLFDTEGGCYCVIPLCPDYRSTTHALAAA